MYVAWGGDVGAGAGGCAVHPANTSPTRSAATINAAPLGHRALIRQVMAKLPPKIFSSSNLSVVRLAVDYICLLYKWPQQEYLQLTARN